MIIFEWAVALIYLYFGVSLLVNLFAGTIARQLNTRRAYNVHSRTFKNMVFSCLILVVAAVILGMVRVIQFLIGG